MAANGQRLVLGLSQFQVMTKPHPNMLLTLKVVKSGTNLATFSKVQSKSLIHSLD